MFPIASRRRARTVLSGRILLLLSLGLPGCALTPVTAPVTADRDFGPLQQMFADAQVTDARFQGIEGTGFLAVDLPLRYRMAGYAAAGGLEQKRQLVAGVLDEAGRVALRVMALHIERLPAAQLDRYRAEHLPEAASNDAILESYRRRARQALAEEQARVARLQTEQALDAYWQDFTGRVQDSILTKGRVARQLATAPAVPFVKGWIAYHEATDHRGPLALDFRHSEVYRPQAGALPEGVTQEDWTLLAHFAPNIVHEVNPGADYPVSDDRFGRVALQGATLAQARPVVDTGHPALYAYVDRRTIQGMAVRQLVYTLWHPAHPQLSRFDPEAGILDGWTVRITLDRLNRPLDYESVSNCGCYYKNFPSDRLEAAAARTHPERLSGKQFHIENDVKGEYDAIVPELVRDADPARPQDSWLYFSAGHHQLITIRSSAQAGDPGQIQAERRYELLPYAELERLPFNGHRASLFDTEGLVRSAHRPECTMLMPSGLYHAGHPRQRETQLIYFDDAVFDDPRLLETYLRLPPAAFGN